MLTAKIKNDCLNLLLIKHLTFCHKIIVIQDILHHKIAPNQPINLLIKHNLTIKLKNHLVLLIINHHNINRILHPSHKIMYRNLHIKVGPHKIVDSNLHHKAGLHIKVDIHMGLHIIVDKCLHLHHKVGLHIIVDLHMGLHLIADTNLNLHHKVGLHIIVVLLKGLHIIMDIEEIFNNYKIIMVNVFK